MCGSKMVIVKRYEWNSVSIGGVISTSLMVGTSSGEYGKRRLGVGKEGFRFWDLTVGGI